MFGRSKSTPDPEVELERELHANSGRAALARVITNNRVNANAGLAAAPRTFGAAQESINEMTVRIDPDGAPSFEVALTVLTSLTDETAPYGYPPIAPLDSWGQGPTIPVIYDPAQPARIAYDRSPEGAATLAAWHEQTRPARAPPRVRRGLTSRCRWKRSPTSAIRTS